MNSRRRALAALVGSSSLLVASGVAFAMSWDSGVGTDLEQVTATRSAAELAISRGPARPAADSPTTQRTAEQPQGPSLAESLDIPVVDATTIVIEAPAPPPLGLRIPSVDVDMPIAATGVQDDGQMALPENPNVIGWYKFGAMPGDKRGSAVLGGHVDSIADGVGPLSRLASVEVGERVVVTDDEGRPVRYEVTSVERITKAALPVDVLFRPDGPHQLAVITCGGRYIPDAGGYEDNIVVLARPVAR